MARKFILTKTTLETFFEESGINYRIELGDEKAKILKGIMNTRFAGWTIVKQSKRYHISVDTVNKYIKELKELYDETQKYSKILPIRKNNNDGE